MNATELYEVVKDVPREAWPPGITWYDHQLWGYADSGVLFDHNRRGLVLLFEASMLRWLIGEGHHYFEYILGDNAVTLKMYDDVSVCVPLDGGSKVQTQTRLLAAACKAVEASK